MEEALLENTKKKAVRESERLEESEGATLITLTIIGVGSGSICICQLAIIARSLRERLPRSRCTGSA